MKHIKTIVLGALALFYGIYAMVLELNGIANYDQVGIAILLSIFTFVTAG
jgi:hypothetical protein